MRRFRILPISSEFFRALIIQKGLVGIKTEGIPDDIEIIDAWFDPLRNEFLLKLESSEFSSVGRGEEIPKIMPTIAEVRLTENRKDVF